MQPPTHSATPSARHWLLRMTQKLARVINRSKQLILLIILVATLTTVLNVLIATWLSRSSSTQVYTFGTVRVTGVEAYGGDLKTVNDTAVVDWGTVNAEQSKTVSFKVRSISNIPVKLTFNVTDWQPEDIRKYIQVTWNYSGETLNPQQETQLSFTLKAPYTREFAEYTAKNTVQTFNFTIHIQTSTP
jgi:hypothetical protein